MTKGQLNDYFIENIMPAIAEQYEADGIPDRPARREGYNNMLDYLSSDGLITRYQADNYAIPDWLENTRWYTLQRRLHKHDLL